MIPKYEQSKAILEANTWELAQKYTFGNHEELKGKLNVSVEDLRAYIDKNGFPKGWWHFEVKTQDGLYCVKEAQNWIVYFQERGKKYYQFPDTFKEKEDAIKFILKKVYLKK